MPALYQNSKIVVVAGTHLVNEIGDSAPKGTRRV